MTARQAFLERVRRAVADGNRAGLAAPLPERGRVGYQGAGPDAAGRYCHELQAAGGFPHRADDVEGAADIVIALLQSRGATRVLLGRDGMLDRLDLAPRLSGLGIDVLSTADPRDRLFTADVGISGAYRLVAETGTVVMSTRPDEPRSLSLLPPVHIVVAHTSQLLPDLFDLFDLFSPAAHPPPSCLSLITGPSKTGDIELRLVTGVHGPGEVHVVLMGT